MPDRPLCPHGCDITPGPLSARWRAGSNAIQLSCRSQILPRARALRLSDDETHIVDRPHIADHTPEEAPGDRKVLAQPPDIEQRLGVLGGGAVHAGSAGP